ncbi:unnamed protein product [Gadus morhua 'NCC']
MSPSQSTDVAEVKYTSPKTELPMKAMHRPFRGDDSDPEGFISRLCGRVEPSVWSVPSRSPRGALVKPSDCRGWPSVILPLSTFGKRRPGQATLDRAFPGRPPRRPSQAVAWEEEPAMEP